MAKQLRVTLVRSPIGYRKDQAATARALGLRRLHATVVVEDNSSYRGLIHKIKHLLKVEEVES